MSVNTKRIAPAPIIDNLDQIGNPFLGDESVVDANTDLEYALKFLYSYNGSSCDVSWRIDGKILL